MIVAWALVLAFGLNVGELLKSFPPLYVATGNPDFGGDTFSEIVQWLVVIDIAAVGLGTATSTIRGVFALARDRHLPSPLAAVHDRFKTPYIAASACRDRGDRRGDHRQPERRPCAGHAGGSARGWFPIFQFGATIGAFLIFVVYLLIALTGFKGQPGEHRGGLALAGLLAGATAVAALYGV